MKNSELFTEKLKELGFEVVDYKKAILCRKQIDKNIRVDIFICKDKILCVFIDPHSDGATETVCKLKSCQYYSYSYSTDNKEVLKRIKDWVEKWKKCQSKYPYISIYARVMKIEINGK